MASGKSPHNVDRASIFRSLEQQNAGSFRVVRIVLNDFRGFHTFDKFPCKQPISSDLVVSVLRNSDTALRNQRPNAVERITHNSRRRRVCL